MPSVSRSGRLSVGMIAVLFMALAFAITLTFTHPAAAGGGGDSCVNDMVAGEVRDVVGPGCTVAGDIEIQIFPTGTVPVWLPLYDSDERTGTILSTGTTAGITVRAPWGAGVTRNTSRSALDIVISTLNDGCGQPAGLGCAGVLVYADPNVISPTLVTDGMVSTIAAGEARLVPINMTVPFKVEIMGNDLQWRWLFDTAEDVGFVLRTTAPTIVRAFALTQVVTTDPIVVANTMFNGGCNSEGCRSVDLRWWPENRGYRLGRFRAYAPIVLNEAP